MECPSCHADGGEGLASCAFCGTPFDVRCPTCGSATGRGAKFCSECGQRLPSAVGRQPITGLADENPAETPIERRQLTVMFYDLAESTALATALDPEDLHEVIGAFHRCVTAEVRRFGGFAARYVGDGALIYFGYPQAHENDAERAIAAGLAAIDAVSKLVVHGYRLHLRIGIATGLVVVGDIVGTGVAPEKDVAGETPNLAARLQGLAEPDWIVVSATTRRLCGGLFDYTDLGKLTLKGFAEAQQVWRVTGRSTVDSRFEARRDGGLTRLIGRRAELALLLRRWRLAKAGKGQVVLLSGEAGIGKSRIAAILLERLARERHLRLRYFCSPHQQGSPLAPCISQLERAAGLQPDDPPARKREKLEAILPPESRQTAAVALLADLLSIPSGDEQPPLNLTPLQRREQTLDVLVRLLELLSRETPIVATFEDVHWIDPTSAELIDRVVARVADLPVLLVITFRPEYRPPWRGPQVTPVTLGPLTRQQALAVVSDTARGALPPAVTEEIITRADGVPLFLEELTKAIIEAGGAGAAPGEAIPDDTPRGELVVPATLHASLLARLDYLGAAKEIAQIGAAIGREFSFALLAAVAQRDPAELTAALRRLTEAGLVFRRGELPGASFLFKHALVQDTAYSTLLRATRRRLHARIADCLAARFPDLARTRPELLAHHYNEAGSLQKSADYWLKAGQQALGRSALAEAATQLRRGLEVLARSPEGSERDRSELALLMELGKVLIATKGHAAPATGQTFARARELCEILDHPPQIISVLHGQWSHALLRAELASARQRAAELLRLGETRGELVWQVMGYRCYGVTSYPLGEFQIACDYLDRGLALFDTDRRAAFAQWTVDDLQVVMLYYSSWALLYLGHIDQARRRCDAALAEARRLAQPYTLAHALIAATLVRLVLEDYDGAQIPLAEVLALAEEHGILYFKLVGSLFRGRCLTEMGRAPEAVEVLTHSLGFYRATGSLLYLPTFQTYLAVAYAKAGRPEQALAELDEVAELVERTGTRCDEADMYRLRGELQAMIGDRAGAERSLATALAVARRQSARLWELRAATSLAGLWRNQARYDEARRLVQTARNGFTEGFDTVPLRNAEAIIAGLG